MFTLRRTLRLGRRPILPAIAAAAVLAIPSFAAPPSVAAVSATHLVVATFTDSGIPTDGVPIHLGLFAIEADGDIDSCYDHTVHFTDPFAVVPADFTYQALNFGVFCIGNQGMYIFELTPTRPGLQTLYIQDINQTNIKGSYTMDVQPGPAGSFAFSAAKPNATKGSTATFSLSVKDLNGYPATNYGGTVHFTTSDAAAAIPADYAFNATDAGSHTFPITFNTTGSQTVTVTDVANPSVHASVTVNVLATPHFEIYMTNRIAAGVTPECYVDAVKSDGTADTTYAGTVHLSSTDPNADLGGNLVFQNEGYQRCYATFLTAGVQSMTATDLANPAITGTGTLEVMGADAVALTVIGMPSSMVAGQTTVTVKLSDTYGNNAGSGNVKFSSSDPKAVLPSGIQYFGYTHHGVRTFTITLATEGPQTVTIASASVAHPFATTLPVLVLRGQVSQLLVYGLASPFAAGSTGSLTVRAADDYGNTDESYHGTVHFTTTDSRATLPADYTFTPAELGMHVFAGVGLKTAGVQGIRARDASVASITGRLDVSVAPGPAVTLQLTSTVRPWTAGAAGSVTITARDAYANKASGYRGTIHFTSTDTRAGLPADYLFTAADAGLHTFSLTLKTSGRQGIRARDTVTGAITGRLDVTVSAATAASLSILPPAGSVAPGTAATFRVSALDAFGNVATGYRGTIHWTSTDTKAVLPADYAFSATDAGTHAFSITFAASGAQAVRASDTGNKTLTARVAVTVAG